MIALKSQKLLSRDDGTNPKHAPSAALLYKDYGRSLRRSVMCKDAFYTLNEIFAFAASSEMAFLNLIEHKLNKFTQSDEREFDMLPNLKYTKSILYRHIQKIEQVLDSIRNTDDKKWPKPDASEAIKKADGASRDLTQDFENLKNRAQMLHTRCYESITVLMSSMSIDESKKAISQAERVGKLTLLAFGFVPLSFTTSFFGMNVREFENKTTSIWWWVVLSVPVFGFAIAFFWWDLGRPFGAMLRRLKDFITKL